MKMTRIRLVLDALNEEVGGDTDLSHQLRGFIHGALMAASVEEEQALCAHQTAPVERWIGSLHANVCPTCNKVLDRIR